MKRKPLKKNSVAVRFTDEEFEIIKTIDDNLSQAIRTLLYRYINDNEHKPIRRSQDTSD